MCLFRPVERAQHVLDRLARAVAPFGVFCTFQVQNADTQSLVPNLMFDGEQPILVDHFSYMGSLSKNGHTMLEGNTFKA